MSFKINGHGDLVWKNEKDELHREKGPAVICTNGYVEYAFNDKFHRLDGPAIIWPNGDKYYYIYDECYSKEEYWDKIKGYEFKN